MAYLNKFNSHNDLYNYTASQEYSEPFVGYAADPYEIVRYNTTTVMLINDTGIDLKVPVNPVIVDKGSEDSSCPTYNNEYLQPFTSDGTTLPASFCVVPVDTDEGIVYKIYELNGTEIAAEPMYSTFPRTLIVRSLGIALKPENYYKLFLTKSRPQ